MDQSPASKTPPAGSEPGASAWSPLRQAVFRSIWIASVTSNIGMWMQSVGVAWLMTSLTPSPLLVALMQTASSLPIFFVGLPAGALADVVDRRKLLLVTGAWKLLVALALAVFTLTGVMSAWTLLALTFLLGLGSAFDAPAWQAIVPELVERKELPSAVALNATGFNVSRAVGPALGGLIVAAAGPAAVFFLNAASFLVVLVAIYRWRRDAAPGNTHPEDVLGATIAGMRYVRHAPALKAVLVRTGVFMLGASALWALLPVVTRYELGMDATGYGIILGSLGLGALGGALLMPRLRQWLPVDRLITAATLIFAGSTLALAYLRSVPLLVVCMMLGGTGWLAMMSNLTVAAQTASPGWARARTLGIYLLVFQGLMAVGSFGWGALAEQFGSGIALSLAAAVLVGGIATTLRWPIQTIQRLDLSPSGHWRDPSIVINPDPEEGPVLITVEYRVPAERANEYLQAMETMRSFRLREGAFRWDLFRDLSDPDRYIENFLVATWGEHMRQHVRVTVEDQAIEARAFSFLQPGFEQYAVHFIAARAHDHQLPAQSPDAGVS